MGCAGVIDAPVVQELVNDIRRRGPDNLGIAWMERATSDWELSRYRTPSWPEPFSLEIHGYSAAIAHARLATSGSTEPRDAQPFMLGDLIFAHNGTVYQHRELAAQHCLGLTTGNDSEALARLFLANKCDSERTYRALARHQTAGPHSWIAAYGRKMWIAVYGQPMYLLRSGPASRYASSWRIPGSMEVLRGTVIEWNI